MTVFVTRHVRTDDGLTLNVRDYVGPSPGGPVILCLPGMTRNARDFEQVAQRLAGQSRVLCVDLRGRGGSDWAPDPMIYQPHVYASDVQRLLDALEIPRAVLVGTSMGGFVAMLVAQAVPDRVAAIVLNDVGPDETGADPKRIAAHLAQRAAYGSWEEAAAHFERTMAPSFPAYGRDDWLAVARRQCSEREDGYVVPDYDPAIAAPLMAPDARRHDRWAVFRSLGQLPILVIRAERSQILSRETLANMAAVAPGLESVEVPGIGHAPYLNEPDIPERIARFVAGHW